MLKSAILFITWQCQNWCPYCWQRQAQKNGEFTPEPFLPVDRWVEALNRLDIETLDISGGEPTMQPDFFRMLERLNARRIAMTSNLVGDLTEFVQRISPEKVFSITASLHPTGKMTNDVFTGKILLLKARGFNVTVNFVTYPEQMYMLPHYRAHFERLGFRFHVDPYAQTKFFPYSFTQEERDFLRPYIAQDRETFFMKKPEAKEDALMLCSGGRTHLNIQPNGDAYRCIFDKVEGLAKVGNIFDPAFEPYATDRPCSDWWRCSGCDRDKVTLTRPSLEVIAP